MADYRQTVSVCSVNASGHNSAFFTTMASDLGLGPVSYFYDPEQYIDKNERDCQRYICNSVG